MVCAGSWVGRMILVGVVLGLAASSGMGYKRVWSHRKAQTAHRRLSISSDPALVSGGYVTSGKSEDGTGGDGRDTTIIAKGDG